MAGPMTDSEPEKAPAPTRPSRRVAIIAGIGLLAVACSTTWFAWMRGDTAPAPSASEPPPAPAPLPSPAETTASIAGSAAPLSTAEPAPSAAPSAHPGRPKEERPSAKVERPVTIRKSLWGPVFGTYGHLADMDDLLDDVHYKYPDKTRIVQLATTHQGRNVKALLIADHPEKAEGRPAVLLNGAHHGNEPLSAIVVLDAIDSLLAGAETDPKMKRYLSELAIWCVPLVNPDGFATFLMDFTTGRKNGRNTWKPGDLKNLHTRGVDLNRNYPFRWGYLREVGSRSKSEFKSYRGPRANSEPETQAMVALSDRLHFVGSISYHTGTLALLAPYTIDGVKSPEPNEAWLVAEDVARAVNAGPKPPDKRKLYVRRNLYPVDGTDQDYHRGAHGTLALLFEAAAKNWDKPEEVQKTLAAMRVGWMKLFDRYLDGPSVEGHVRDADGNPVSAEVQVADMKLQSGEVWKSRCPDGFFGRYLPKLGKLTIRVVPEGGSPIDAEVEVTEAKGRASVDIVVPVGSGSCKRE